MAAIHQVNHPGQELNILYRTRNSHKFDYFFYSGNNTQGVRLWNRCFINGKANSHKRKFIEINGKYVDSLQNSTEKASLLRFWGEYEGHSEFELLSPLKNVSYWNNPKVVHRPFFCDQNINDQNTDPFVFDNNFYYAICKKASLNNLGNGDIILFGSEFGTEAKVKFYLDTLFVVKDEQKSILDNTLYDIIYEESTLKRIGISDCTKGTMPVHTGIKFPDNNEYFSFFPCKQLTNENRSFGRPVIDTVSLGLKKPGARTGSKSKELLPNENIADIWKNIAGYVIKQGFVLGTHADQLKVLNQLPCLPIIF
jgi:hypothetical protein